MKVSVVIRTHNEEEHIGKLLSGILEQTIKDIETIIVDSGSTDATIAIASRYPVRILKIAKEEFSFGRSLNIGCRQAQGEIIVLASAHIYPVCKDWLENLLKPFGDAKVALVYGKQRGNEETGFSENQIFRRWFPDESDHGQSHAFCNNANAAVRKSVWMKIDYNETLTGLEDLDWAKRTMEAGYKIVYSSDAEVVHIHNERPLQIYNRYRREAIALKAIYPQEKFSFWNFCRLFLLNSLSDFYNAFLDKSFRRNSKNIVLFRLMQFWGAYRGFSSRTEVTCQLREKFYYPNSIDRRKTDDSVSESGRMIDYSDIQEQSYARKAD